MSLTLQEIAVEVGEWSHRNFGYQRSKQTGQILGSIAPLLGMVEELGEYAETLDCRDAIGDIGIYLCDFAQRDEAILKNPKEDYSRVEPIAVPIGKIVHCVLKRHQGIRGFDNYDKYSEERDKAIEILVQRLEHSSRQLFDVGFVTIVEETWQKVKLRDWQKNKESAHKEQKNEMLAQQYGKAKEVEDAPNQ